MFRNRALISFPGYCKLQCKHCYTFSKECTLGLLNDDDECDKLIDSIDNSADIVYISHDRENFLDEHAGLKLVKGIFDKKRKSIFIITRCMLSDNCINELSLINEEMNDFGLSLIVAVSIPALESYGLLEQKDIISTPIERIDVIKRLHSYGIHTILMVRPLLPDSIIPTEEALRIIDLSYNFIDAVVSSGLAVNDTIINRLGLANCSFEYMNGSNAEFLIGAEIPDISYVDTEAEISAIADYCKSKNIRFYRHSLDAINGII